MQFDYELLYPDDEGGAGAVEMAYPVPAAGGSAGFGAAAGGAGGGHGSQWPNVAVLSAVLLVALAANFLALPVILFRYEKRSISKSSIKSYKTSRSQYPSMWKIEDDLIVKCRICLRRTKFGNGLFACLILCLTVADLAATLFSVLGSLVVESSSFLWGGAPGSCKVIGLKRRGDALP